MKNKRDLFCDMTGSILNEIIFYGDAIKIE